MKIANKIKQRVGFMQGRLSPVLDGRIQAFPWQYWRDELNIAGQNRFSLMEWTLDHDRLYKNPLMTVKGQDEIKELMINNKVNIKSLTGDCFMQAPFYKASANEIEILLKEFSDIVKACSLIGIESILIPLVDDGRLENEEHEENLCHMLEDKVELLKRYNVKICFESDFSPPQLAHFINKYGEGYFGITYDIGNSAALGYDYMEEIELYGHRIVNVHVKDRIKGGGTVPLGSGDADLPGVIKALAKISYQGNFILQTARAENGDDVKVLSNYKNMLEKWIYQGGQ